MSAARTPEATAFFEAVRRTCPSFAATDDAGSADWLDDGDGPLDYLRIANLARHLVEHAGADDECLPKVLELVEPALDESDDYLHGLMTDGLLEDVQNAAFRANGEAGINEVRRRLGPRATAAWDSTIRGWEALDEAQRRGLTLPQAAAFIAERTRAIR